MEARIQVSTTAGIIEKTITISEDPTMRNATLSMLHPPIVIIHGKEKNDPVEVRRGAKYELIEMGENRVYLVGENKKLRIIHEPNPEPF